MSENENPRGDFWPLVHAIEDAVGDLDEMDDEGRGRVLLACIHVMTQATFKGISIRNINLGYATSNSLYTQGELIGRATRQIERENN